MNLCCDKEVDNTVRKIKVADIEKLDKIDFHTHYQNEMYRIQQNIIEMNNEFAFLEKRLSIDNDEETETIDYDEEDEVVVIEHEHHEDGDDNEEGDSDGDADAEDELDENTYPWLSSLSKVLVLEIENIVGDMIEDYVQMEILNMSSASFHTHLVEEVSVLLHQQLKEVELYHCTDADGKEVHHLEKNICQTYFENGVISVPPRSCSSDLPYPLSAEQRRETQLKIEKLKKIPQPAQKTQAWYDFRHGLITASNIWKIFKSECQQNSLICEKCKPQTMNENQSVNISSSLHWGVKYEPLTVMIYEHKYQTHVDDFGCIRHSLYPFLGASPDGIVNDPSSDRFGRMIEIKNIVNRLITPFPKDEYWIQMQIQMETCDLEECDFVETRFKEYENEEKFLQSAAETPSTYRGVILHFVPLGTAFDNVSYTPPFYQYMPICYPQGPGKVEIDSWREERMAELSTTHVLYKTIYWYLDEFSCILVKRNRLWFAQALPKIEETWKIIEKERREGGFEHRLPKKKVKTEVIHEHLENALKADFLEQERRRTLEGDPVQPENEPKTYIKNLPFLNNLNVVKLDP